MALRILITALSVFISVTAGAFAQIKLPDVYRRKPLYTVALYHELGHFMDTRFAISENVEVLRADLALPGMSAPTGALTPAQKQVRLLHLREYFADLFAVCYCGSAIKRFLEGFAPHAGVSPPILRRIIGFRSSRHCWRERLTRSLTRSTWH